MPPYKKPGEIGNRNFVHCAEAGWSYNKKTGRETLAKQEHGM